MKAIFVGGVMDGRVEEIESPHPSVFAAFPPEMVGPTREDVPIEPCWKQVEYVRTQSTDAAVVYMVKK